jgi:hypothetical protein
MAAVGPVDVIIIGFPGNKFTGEIAPAILELVDSGTIRVLDLLFLTIEIADPDALNHEDAEEVGDDLPLDSSALLIAFENTWAARFVAACQAADAVVIDQIRIPVDVVNALVTAG